MTSLRSPLARGVAAAAAAALALATVAVAVPSASGAASLQPRNETYGNWAKVGNGFNGSTSNTVYRLLRKSDGTLIAAGTFGRSFPTTVNRVAAFNGTSWGNLAPDDSGISPGVPTTLNANGDFPGVFGAKLSADDTLYVAGNFRYADDDTVNNVARWTGSSWKRMGKGLTFRSNDYPLQDVIVGNDPSHADDTNYADDTIYAVGGITGICTDLNSCPTSGGAPYVGVTAWTDDTWVEVSSDDFNFLPITGAYMDTGTDDTLIVAGEFTTIGVGNFNRIAAYDYATSTWKNLGTGNFGFNGNVYAATVHPTTGDLYVGGTFTQLCTNALCTTTADISDGVAKWDRQAQQWYSVGSGYTSPNVDDIAFSPDGSVMYASGFGGSAGGYMTNGVMTLAGGDLSAGATNVGGTWNYLLSAGVIGVNPAAVRSLVVNNDGSAYAAGNFTSAGALASAFSVALFTPGPKPDPNIPATPPGPPLNVVAKAGWQTVTVSWDPPLDQGTYPITNYLAQATAVGAAPAGNVCITRLTDAKLTECTFTSLKPGVQYTFQVQGLNGGGWGARSEASNIATPYELKVTGYGRKKLSFLKIPLGSEVSAKGTSLGYPAGTRITVFIKEGDSGQWVEQKNSGLTTNASGTFSWQRKFSKGKDGTPISVQFGIGSDRSNAVRIPAVK